MSTDNRQTLGKLGEDLACAELERRGYAITDRRYRTRFGEIDIVARYGEEIAFIEVKARVGGEFGGGAAAVTGPQGLCFLRTNAWDNPSGRAGLGAITRVGIRRDRREH